MIVPDKARLNKELSRNLVIKKRILLTILLHQFLDVLQRFCYAMGLDFYSRVNSQAARLGETKEEPVSIIIRVISLVLFCLDFFTKAIASIQLKKEEIKKRHGVAEIFNLKYLVK